MLVDTGASISIIPEDVYLTIPEDERPKLETVDLRILVGNGELLPQQGVCRLKFQLGDFDFDHEFFVCRQSGQAILGNEFFVHYNMVLRMSEGWLEFKGHCIPLLNSYGVRKKSRVYVRTAVAIEPGQEMEIPTYVKRPTRVRRPQMFEPRRTCKPTAVWLPPGCCSIHVMTDPECDCST